MSTTRSRYMPHWKHFVYCLVVLLLISNSVGDGFNVLEFPAGRLQFSTENYATSIEIGLAYLTVQRHLGSTGKVSVLISVLPGEGDAVEGDKFKGIHNQRINWEDGDMFDKEVHIPIINDGEPQYHPLTFVVHLHNAVEATINPALDRATITIMPSRNLRPGYLSFTSNQVIAQEDSVGVVRIPVAWSGGTTETASVAFEIQCGNACYPDDFILKNPTNQRLTWLESESTIQYIELEIPQDHIYEQDEYFNIKLVPILPPVEALVGNGELGDIPEVMVTIQGPNDVSAGIIQFESDCFPSCASQNYEVKDGGLVNILVKRIGGSDGEASALISTRDGSAIAGNDYVAYSERLTWNDGESSAKEVFIATIKGVVRRSSVQFTLELTDSRGAKLTEEHSRITSITIAGPANILSGVIDFVNPPALENVLTGADASFFHLSSLQDSGKDLCPDIVVMEPKIISVIVHRSFSNVWPAASVMISTRQDTAIADIDYVAIQPPIVLSWEDGEKDDKIVQLEIMDPGYYFTDLRYFYVEMSDTSNINIGSCGTLKIVLDSVGQPPQLLSFDIDMTVGSLLMRFNHAAKSNTFDPTKLRLQSTAIKTLDTEAIQLTVSTSTPPDIISNELVVIFGADDFLALQGLGLLGKRAETTFLAVDDDMLIFTQHNCLEDTLSGCVHLPIVPISEMNALQALSFVTDIVAPKLLGFSLDMTKQLLKLHFSEPVDRSTTNVEGIRLSDTVEGIDSCTLSASSTTLFSPTPDPMSGALLYEGNKLPLDGTYITLMIGEDDLNTIQLTGNGKIGIDKDSTYLSIFSIFITDMAVPGNPVEPIAES